MDNALGRRLLCALAAGLLGACEASPNPQEKPMTLDPATAAHQEHGYSERPVEARLGPHRYLIPAHYFYDQIGPDFQGGVALSLQWPDLQPLPPGTNFHDDPQTFGKAVAVRLDFVDRVPIATLLDRMTRPPVDSEHQDDPAKRFDARIQGEPFHGLTPYYADLDKLEAYFRRTGAYTTPERLLASAKDWYAARDARGELTTVVTCDARQLPDGLTVRGDRLLDDEQADNAACDHAFVVAEDGLSVSVGYNRVFLKDWKRIEDRVRALLAQYRTH